MGIEEHSSMKIALTLQPPEDECVCTQCDYPSFPMLTCMANSSPSCDSIFLNISTEYLTILWAIAGCLFISTLIFTNAPIKVHWVVFLNCLDVVTDASFILTAKFFHSIIFYVSIVSIGAPLAIFTLWIVDIE